MLLTLYFTQTVFVSLSFFVQNMRLYHHTRSTMKAFISLMKSPTTRGDGESDRSLTSDTGSSQADSGSQKVHFQLSGLGQDFHIELWEASENLFAPGFTIQVLGKRGTKSLRAYQREDLCFYQGSLRSRVNSSVALSTCMGMVSLNTFRLVCFGV